MSDYYPRYQILGNLAWDALHKLEEELRSVYPPTSHAIGDLRQQLAAEMTTVSGGDHWELPTAELFDEAVRLAEAL